MSAADEHYRNMLSGVYTWMCGGFDAKLDESRRFFSQHGISPRAGGIAVDLGCGPGFQSVTLAECGFHVLSIDTSRELLDELKGRSGGATGSISPVHDDLMHFPRHCARPPELVVCMGDTLTHLDTIGDVRRLIETTFNSLEKGGVFIITYRDLTMELEGAGRLIPVRLDRDILFLCFVEYEDSNCAVINDILIAGNNGEWDIQTGSYRKLRIKSTWLTERLIEAGFNPLHVSSGGGMTALVMKK